MWAYDPDADVSDLKLIAFDYIREGFEQTLFRNIISAEVQISLQVVSLRKKKFGKILEIDILLLLMLSRKHLSMILWLPILLILVVP